MRRKHHAPAITAMEKMRNLCDVRVANQKTTDKSYLSMGSSDVLLKMGVEAYGIVMSVEVWISAIWLEKQLQGENDHRHSHEFITNKRWLKANLSTGRLLFTFYLTFLWIQILLFMEEVRYNLPNILLIFYPRVLKITHKNNHSRIKNVLKKK